MERNENAIRVEDVSTRFVDYDIKTPENDLTLNDQIFVLETSLTVNLEEIEKIKAKNKEIKKILKDLVKMQESIGRVFGE